jgi:hypothetical protein
MVSIASKSCPAQSTVSIGFTCSVWGKVNPVGSLM